MSLNYDCDQDVLWKFLFSYCKIGDVSMEFSQIKENSERIRFLLNRYEEFGVIARFEETLKLEKNNAIAESCRTKGNQFYVKKHFLDALSSYNESLCFAKPESKNIALAYANRSAVYCELKLYEKFLKNIELAKTNHYPNIEKMKEREETCKTMINNKSSQSSPSNVPIGRDYLKLSHEANKKLPFLANCLELRTNKKFGRHITTKTALQPGDVVCCEEPFTKFLLPSHRYKYCATCLNDNFLDLFPCKDCTSTMFCSIECERLGQEKFHKFECPIIDTLDAMCTQMWRMGLRAFFEALYVCDGNLEKLKALIKENKHSSETLLDYEFPLKAKNVLKAFDALTTNESKRNEDDILQRAGIVAIGCYLVVKHTKLREILTTRNDEDFFYSFVFKHSQIASVNCHALYNGEVNKSEEATNSKYGIASFPFYSLLNHSCASNAIRLSSDCKSYLVVIRPIPAGGQVFDDYGYNHCSKTLEQRQTPLINQYKFKCSCEACKGNYPLLRDQKNKDFRFNLFVSANDLNVDLARKNFKLYCDYLKKMDHKYPSKEISWVQHCFVKCVKIFATTDFKLKLCEH